MVGITGIMPDDDDEGSPRVVGGLDKNSRLYKELDGLFPHTTHPNGGREAWFRMVNRTEMI